jgi:Flp pilus assembly protein CpaB
MPLIDDVRRRWRTLRRRVLARRRPLAAACAAVAVLVGLRVGAGPPPPTVAVPVAVRDLPAGVVVGPSDLTTAAFAPGTEPSGLPDDPVGRVLAAPVGAGEPVTDVRLVGAGLAEAHPDLTVMPVRLPDAGVVSLLRPGDRIDLLAADPGSGEATPVADDVLVLAVPAAEDDTAADSSAPPGRLVVLGMSPAAAPDVGLAAVTLFLVVAFSR